MWIKRIIITGLVVIIIGLLIYTAYRNIALGKALEQSRSTVLQQQGAIKILQERIDELEHPKNGVKDHGKLSVDGAQLLNSRGQPVQLRGMSSHGLMWYPQYTNYRAIETTKKCGANVFRLAMYTDQKNGYVYNPEEAKQMLFMALENVLGADMYAIVDWHILKDNNPNTYIEQAKEFFSEVSRKYAHEPGVIYEICNEPNGDTTWQDIKDYADVIIPIIRENAPHAVILVGTPNFCVDIESAIAAPLNYENVMYTYHLYTGTCKGGYKKSLSNALNNNIPVFVSEWGLSYEKDTNEISYGKAREFLDFLNQNQISWVNWSLSNKQEVYSVLINPGEKLSGWNKGDLTERGRFIFEALSGE